MNQTLEVMLQRRSIRSYQDKPVPENLLDQVLRAAWHSPTSVNGQQISLIVVRNAEQRKKIAELAGGQSWIAQAPVFIVVVADFYKTRLGAEIAGKKQIIHESMEGFTVGAIDAGIILGNLLTAASSVGLGTVPIGAVRREPEAIIELLGLPALTFPMVGMAMGYIKNDSPIKPRLPLESFVHYEVYNAKDLPMHIATYDKTLSAYWKQQGRPDGLPWSLNTSTYYEHMYFPKVAPTARKQGFGFDL